MITALCVCGDLMPSASYAVDAIVPAHGRALSLRVLQDMAAACYGPDEQCDEAVEALGFIRRIDGFVVDRRGRDIVLVGRVNQNWPLLHLEDLVVALRDAWHLYGRRRGEVIYIANPGVSIDPHPKVIARLGKIGREMNRGGNMEAALDAWRRVCRLPQKVRVEGVPGNTRFAATMLTVDYDLKGLADGNEATGIKGFQSLASRHMEAAKKAVQDGRAMNLSSMSRFWFYPRKLRVMADRDAAIIDKGFGLQVMTEEEYLDARGKITGKGRPHPLAGEFARDVTAHYDRIANERPAWRELENLAWMVALARTLRYRDALHAARLDLSWLLTEFPTPSVSVPREVPGRSNILGFDYRRATNNGYIVGALRLPSCGGVELAVSVEGTVVHNPRLPSLSEKVLKKRPDKTVLYWDF